ncbi:MAG: hypothetical protein ABR95_06340 [Sphingobacteriales bacterium BACL12 MAG-120813-bin55]|nr:MAG: hypothetical protein ABR95_06340 [Sphingobacteriales bacterium BACL12 MAG-120813-bin55]
MTKAKKKTSNPGILHFLVSRAFLLNVVLAVVAFLLLVWLTLWGISRYSRHAESQTVPDLTGLVSSDAAALLDRAGLELSVIDSTFQNDVRPMTVISQDPPSGARVKGGRTIYVVVNRKEPPPTEIPYIEVGTSYLSVVEILESRGLKLGNISYRPFQYKDVFIEMRIQGKPGVPKPGTKVAKGSKVDLVLGNGLGDTKVEVPDLIGLTYYEAINLIQLKELNVGTVIASGAISDTIDAFIVRQFPPSGADQYINMGSMLDIWISDSAPDLFQDEENID